MPYYIILTLISGFFWALYISIDRGILKSRFDDYTLNYTIFSWWVGALITLIIVLLLWFLGLPVPSFHGLRWLPKDAWLYLLLSLVANGITGAIYFITLSLPLGSVYWGVLGGFALIWTELLSTFPGPIGLGERLTSVQGLLIFVTLIGTVFVGWPHEEHEEKERRFHWQEMIFLLIFVVFFNHLVGAFVEIWTRKALNLGVEPLNWRVWYFFSGAIGVTIGTLLIAPLILKWPFLQGVGLEPEKLVQPSWNIMKDHFRRAILWNSVMHIFVFLSFILYYYAQYGEWKGPLSTIAPVRYGVNSALVWIIAGLIGWLWPSFFKQEKESFGHFFTENWWKLIGTLIVIGGLTAFLQVSKG
jgi:uncharacterized membrane protein